MGQRSSYYCPACQR
ncbi:MAG: hypothetical protein GY732_00010 [Gammaproteobacteria bacterium]|nr:hypothetical protein [Gammaproteobacteria bacterium]